MGIYDYKFVVKENVGENSEKCFGKPNEIIYQMSKDGFISKNGNMFIMENILELNRLISYTNYSTVFELYEEETDTEELGAIEAFELYQEIMNCAYRGCSQCVLKEIESKTNCRVDNMEKEQLPKLYEILKKYKKDRKATIEKEKKYGAVWRYLIYLDEKQVDTAETELEAMQKCEKYVSENPFDTYAWYRKVCFFEEVTENE